MYFYAQVDEQHKIVQSVCQSVQPTDKPHLFVEIDSFDESLIGKKWKGKGRFDNVSGEKLRSLYNIPEDVDLSRIFPNH